jgi:uncharacterized membrane protein YkvA (DUF1232 family)
MFWKSISKQVDIYKHALKDSRTPLMVKIFLALGIGYLIMPLDFIPDFIPFLGQLDDSIILPILFIIALFLIPKDVMDDSKAAVKEHEEGKLLAGKK